MTKKSVESVLGDAVPSTQMQVPDEPKFMPHGELHPETEKSMRDLEMEVDRMITSVKDREVALVSARLIMQTWRNQHGDGCNCPPCLLTREWLQRNL